MGWLDEIPSEEESRKRVPDEDSLLVGAKSKGRTIERGVETCLKLARLYEISIFSGIVAVMGRRR